MSLRTENYARYQHVHYKVRALRGAPGPCAFCEAPGQWACMTGNYEDMADYGPLCVWCHSRYDGAVKDTCKRGHLKVPANLQWNSHYKKWHCALCRHLLRTGTVERKQRTLTPKEKDAAFAMMVSGLSGSEVGRRFGVGPSVMSRIRNDPRRSPSGKPLPF